MTRLAFLALALLAKGLFDLVYVVVINQHYEYAGFYLRIDNAKLAISYVLTIVAGLILPCHVKRPSDFLVVMLAGFVLLPVLSYWPLKDESSAHFAVIVGAFALLIAALRMPMIRLPKVGGGGIVCSVLSIFIFIPTAIVLVRGGAIGYLNFDPTKVYDYRNIIHDRVMTGVWAYLIIWTGKVVVITAIVYALYRRHYLLALAGVAADVLLFALTTHKEFAIYPAMALFVYAVESRRRNVSLVFLGAVIALLAVALAVKFSLDEALIPYTIFLLVFRAFYVIANLHFEYMTFFDSAPFVMLSNSILSGVISYPFNKPVPELIGQDRFGLGTEAFANSGYIASAYMHFGVAGVFAYTIIVAVIFRLIDALVAGRIPRPMGMAIAAVAAVQLVNTDLTIVLLTQGMMLSIVFLFLLGDPALNRSQRLAIDTQPALVARVSLGRKPSPQP